VDQLLPLITGIVNKSMDESEMPLCLKRATISPLLKRPGLDKEEMKNYHPISNLPFISKPIEKVVARRIEEHLEHNDLNDIYQSAYRSRHSSSTETTLLKGNSDIAEALDEGSTTALIMLDLFAAFDVIDHPILLKRLEFSFGIKEKALTWVKSYLADRTQCVSVANKTSPDVGLLFGVPQGSVSGPKHYCMYTKPVGEIIKRYNIKYHCYADDTQVYMTLKSCDK